MTEEPKHRFRQADIIMAVTLMMILAVLIIPVPTPLLDLMLVLSIGLGVLVLILTTQIKDALQLSSFPSLLLMLTLFRLSLNVATTRQILLNAYAGKVIQAFGDFVVGGNYVVGIVVFLILVIINFMVITKGSGRIAEVAARFTLDAMPGKQMSIDADLNSGVIDEKEAIRRRENLAKEADFYGAMDGSSKFVRGDAVAGLIITLINITGGFAVGMIQQHMTAANALRTYTILTVGDGLVAQVPALIISTAAGMLVTRAASDDSLGTEVSKQLFLKSKPLIITGGILSAIALVPGLPFLPFIMLGAAMGGLGMVASKVDGASNMVAGGNSSMSDKSLAGRKKTGALPPAFGSKQVPSVSQMDLEIGFGLVPLVDGKQGGKLIDRIGMVRGQIAEEIGFVLPPVNVRDNIKLKNTEYCIKIRGLEVARNTVRPGSYMAISPDGRKTLEGHVKVQEPAFGFDSYWIPESYRETAESKGMTVVDCASVITTHLAELAKRHASEILSRQDVSDMIEKLKEAHPSVVEELIPGKMNTGGVHRVLQGLLRERVSIRDLALILETISDQAGRTQDPAMLVEFCRRSLGGHICHKYITADGTLPAIGVHPDMELILKKSTKRDGSEIGAVIMEPMLAHEVLKSIEDTVANVRKKGLDAVILCSPLVRPQLRQITSHDLNDVAILSFAEVPDSVNVDMCGMVTAPKGVNMEDFEKVAKVA